MIRIVHLLLGTTLSQPETLERLSRLLQAIGEKWAGRQKAGTADRTNGMELEQLIVLFGSPDPSLASQSVQCQSLRPAAQSGGRLEWCSFALLDILRSSSILYLHDPFTQAGEAAFALAKNLGMPCIIDGDADESTSTGWKWGMAALADRIICSNGKRAQQLQRDAKTQAIVCISRPDSLEPTDRSSRVSEPAPEGRCMASPLQTNEHPFWDVDESEVSLLPQMADSLAAVYCDLLNVRPGV